MINGYTLTPSCSKILGGEPRATLLVDPAGVDNSVLFTAKARGAPGELVSIEYLTPTPTPQEVSVTGNAITFKPSTAFIPTIANQVIIAINDDPASSALVTASASGDGTGPVAAVTAAFLALP